jgi:hypothetical protein
MLVGTKYDLLLDRKSKFGCIQAPPSEDLWLFMDCGRWHEVTGTILSCYAVTALDLNLMVKNNGVELLLKILG